MKRILVPVDGSEDSLQAVREVIRQASLNDRGIAIHLINVQPLVVPQETLLYAPIEQVETFYNKRSGEALESAEKLLQGVGLLFVSHRVVGPIAETILAKQRELECDSIVMSTQGHGRIMGALLGSISARVLHLAQVPVTLVKSPPAPDFAGRLSAT